MKKRRTESINFYTALLTFILSPFVYNGVEIPVEFTGVIIDNAFSGNTGALMLLIPQALTIIVKIIDNFKARAFSWRFLQGKNFLTQAFSIIFMVLVYFGWISTEVGAILASVAHALNSSIHILEDGNRGQDRGQNKVTSF